ncbi:eukaryotic initiation factor 4E-like protein, partial [Conglomerata obtusa]
MSLALHTEWNMLYDYATKGKATNETWKDMLKEICTVNTANTLTYALHNAFNVDELPLGSNIHFFRMNIEPAWEDENNVDGGKWVLEINREDEDPRLNDLWRKTVAFCASEQVDGEMITGCVFSPRKFVDRIAIWTRGKGDEIVLVGKMWKRLLEFNDTIQFM